VVYVFFKHKRSHSLLKGHIKSRTVIGERESR